MLPSLLATELQLALHPAHEASFRVVSSVLVSLLNPDLWTRKWETGYNLR